MNPLLQQFLSEARDFLQGIAEKLMQLEKVPNDADLMSELFRFVHTLKGNSGLFEFPEMTRVLHAGEDLLDDVRNGRVEYSQNLADRLLDAMDFVGMLVDEIEAGGAIGAGFTGDSIRLTDSLRTLMVASQRQGAETSAETIAKIEVSAVPQPVDSTGACRVRPAPDGIAGIPEPIRMQAYRLAQAGQPLHWLVYSPDENCYFQGVDPFFQARQTPGLLWGGIVARGPWPKLAELDAYRCQLDFQVLSTAPIEMLLDYYRYMADHLSLTPCDWSELQIPPKSALSDGQLQETSMPVAPAIGLPTQQPAEHDDTVRTLVAIQREILLLPITEPWQLGRLRAVATTLSGCFRPSSTDEQMAALQAATESAVAQGLGLPLLNWLDRYTRQQGAVDSRTPSPSESNAANPLSTVPSSTADPDVDFKFGRRAEDHISGAKSVKVDQAKIDRLMNLIGEMVVSKNALPYLAGRAETVFGVRELSREIKAQYAVINRIAEEMQDAIMQVRMMPVSFVFQRFSRLVRDTSRKLGKDVKLILEGEETEADKNIIESLGDPLVHIIRNSLDHGFELPEVRKAAGKPVTGTLTIRASQEADRVIIDIIDDGKGIDPAVVKRKAYEKGLLDEAGLERISDQDAVNLVFAAGFSTAETISDLSGRGVGMDVVRSAIEKVNGAISLQSEKGKGTRIRLSLPLSIAVTNVMIIESDGQMFGVPMDSVVETVRIPRSHLRSIKQSLATVLRGRIVPIKAINTLLEIAAPPQANADNELAVLVVRLGDEAVGLLVDDFRETVDIILKPMAGVLASMSVFSGSALMGDGSVLLVLDVKELLL